jgi:hypothetical protein
MAPSSCSSAGTVSQYRKIPKRWFLVNKKMSDKAFKTRPSRQGFQGKAFKTKPSRQSLHDKAFKARPSRQGFQEE